MNAAYFTLGSAVEADSLSPEMMEDLGVGITFDGIIGSHSWKIFVPEVKGPLDPGR